MLPHEKALVKRLAGEPFALIGMNTDSDKVDVLAQRFQKDGLEWRQAMLGSPREAEIPKRWNVQGYPTLYLVDAKGVIRNYWLGSPGDHVLDAEIDKLVAEARGPAGKK